MLKAVQGLEEMETLVDEETLTLVDQMLEKIWIEAIAVRKHLHELNIDLHEIDTIIAKAQDRLQARKT